MRYGIPNYRFPRERLQEDIDAILSTGVEVKLNTRIGTEQINEIGQSYDAVFIAIGAHSDKKLNIEGENSHNVISAVDMLREIGDDQYPDFTGKRVIVVGGGHGLCADRSPLQGQNGEHCVPASSGGYDGAACRNRGRYCRGH